LSEGRGPRAPEEAPPTRLSSAGRRLLGSGGLVNVGLATSNVFVSLFFYVTSGSIAKMALYAVGRYAGLIVMSTVVMHRFPDTPPRRLFRIGLTLTAAFFCLLIVLGHHASPLALPLGLFNGVAAGTYWFGNNTLVYDVLRPGERGRYYGLSFAIVSVLNVVMPLTAGFVIARVGGERGYATVFSIALVSYVAAFLAARGLGGERGVGGVSVRRALAFPLARAGWGRMSVALALRGYKQAAGSIGLIVLVAAATHSSEAQGEFAAVASLAGVATSVLAGRVAPAHRPVAMWAGALGFLVATSLLFVRTDLVMLLVYGLVSGLTYPGLMVPLSSVVLETIDGDPDGHEHRGGYILSREISANVGRLLAVGLLFVLLEMMPATRAVLGVLASAAGLQLVVAHLGSTAGAHVARGPVLRSTSS
jgi:YQGE family putative transporter